MSLREIGMRSEDLAGAARAVAQSPGWNPRPVGEAEIASILTAAFKGGRPAADIATGR
jgi:hypothetical protein